MPHTSRPYRYVYSTDLLPTAHSVPVYHMYLCPVSTAHLWRKWVHVYEHAGNNVIAILARLTSTGIHACSTSKLPGCFTQWQSKAVVLMSSNAVITFSSTINKWSSALFDISGKCLNGWWLMCIHLDPKRKLVDIHVFGGLGHDSLSLFVHLFSCPRHRCVKSAYKEQYKRCVWTVNVYLWDSPHFRNGDHITASICILSLSMGLLINWDVLITS